MPPTNNALNKASGSLTVDPGASGDSLVQFDINTTGEFIIGVDDTDADKFKISQGSALGTNDTFVITAAGEITKPLQPAFFARIGSSDTNVTGNGTAYTIGTNVAYTEEFDQSGDFNTNGTFTAPVDGRYFFVGAVRLSGFGSSNSLQFQINYNSVTTLYMIDETDPTPTTTGFYQAQGSCYINMSATDTVSIRINVNGAGSDVVDISGGSNPVTYFGGHLVA